LRHTIQNEYLSRTLGVDSPYTDFY